MSIVLWGIKKWAKYRVYEGGTLYVTYLILGVTTSLNLYSLRKDLKKFDLPLSTINTLLILPSIPWYLKCVFASVSDTCALCGYHRKSYMILGTSISFGLCMVLTIPNLSLGTLFGVLLLLQCSTVLADVNYDALVIEGCKKANSSSLQKNTSICRHLGLMIGMGLGPVIWQDLGSEGIYLVLGLWYLLGVFAAVITKDVKTEDRGAVTTEITQATYAMSIELDEYGNNVNAGPITSKTTCSSIIYWLSIMKASFAHPVLAATLFYYFFMALIPGPGSPLWYFTTDVLRFPPGLMATMSIMYELGGILGYGLYDCGLDAVPIRLIFFFCLVSNVLLGFVPLVFTVEVPGCVSQYHNSTSLNTTYCYPFEKYNLDIVAISLIDALFDGVLATFSYNTLKSVIRILTKKHVEASLYSTVLSLDNVFSAFRTIIESYAILFFGLDSGSYAGLTPYILFCQMWYFIFFAMFIILPYKSLDTLAREVVQAEGGGGAVVGEEGG